MNFKLTSFASDLVSVRIEPDPQPAWAVENGVDLSFERPPGLKTGLASDRA